MAEFPRDLLDRAAAVVGQADAAGLRLATAESCTGGLIVACLTEVPGSSSVVECGFVTYSNQAKTRMLGVPESMIAECGAVSEPVARIMAVGAIAKSGADIAVSVTGIAGPGGGSADKPVGLVHFAASRRGGETLHQVHEFGDIGRRRVRLKSVAIALDLISRLI